MTGPSIFVSYRRDDSAGDAGRLADHLQRRFGAARVFLDIDTIQPGSDFVQVLQSSLEQTAVTLVVIGPRWTARDASGNRRLDDPRDFVRLEVETALKRGHPVVPVLVQGASLPRADELPASLVPLLTRHAASLDHAEFHADAERLCDRLAPLIEYAGPTLWTLPRRRAAAAVVLAVGIGVGGYRWLTSDGARTPPSNADAPAPAAAEAPLSTTPPASSKPASPQAEAAGRATGSQPAAASAVSSTPITRSSSTPRNTGRAGGTTPGEEARQGPQAPIPAAASPDRADARSATESTAEADRAARAAAARTEAAREAAARELAERVDGLVAEAAAQRRRSQFVEALATLARAREMAPASTEVREAQEDLAMYWMRNIRVESGRSTFTDALKPALSVVDAALPTATGARRADLLAHSGWATFLLWRQGNRQLDPAEWYREALSLDPTNPYANAMMGHWLLFQQNEDLPGAVSRFETALKSGRATDAVRALQWSAYGNAMAPEADAERVRVANALRLEGQRLTMDQASALWGPYFSTMSRIRAKEQQVLLAALPPDEHISTLRWAFETYAANDESRQRTIRYYVALLDAAAGRVEQAVSGLRALEIEIAKNPGSLRDAVQDALKRLQPRR